MDAPYVLQILVGMFNCFPQIWLARELVLPFMEQHSLVGLHIFVKQKMSAFTGKPLGYIKQYIKQM